MSLLALAQMDLKWKYLDAGLQKLLLDAVRCNAHRFNAREIANTLLALNKMGLLWRDLDHDLQRLLLDAVRRNADRFNAQNIANSLLALDHYGVELAETLESMIYKVYYWMRRGAMPITLTRKI